MLVAAMEPFTGGFWDEAQHLIQEEWEEVGAGRTLRVKKDAYAQLAMNGLLKFIALRDNGVLVGYALMLWVEDLHESKPTLHLDAMYVAQAARGQKGGVKIVRAAEEWALAHAPSRIVFGASTEEFGKPARLLYGLMGYKPVTKLYQKEF